MQRGRVRHPPATPDAGDLVVRHLPVEAHQGPVRPVGGELVADQGHPAVDVADVDVHVGRAGVQHAVAEDEARHGERGGVDAVPRGGDHVRGHQEPGAGGEGGLGQRGLVQEGLAGHGADVVRGAEVGGLEAQGAVEVVGQVVLVHDDHHAVRVVAQPAVQHLVQVEAVVRPVDAEVPPFVRVVDLALEELQLLGEVRRTPRRAGPSRGAPPSSTRARSSCSRSSALRPSRRTPIDGDFGGWGAGRPGGRTPLGCPRWAGPRPSRALLFAPGSPGHRPRVGDEHEPTRRPARARAAGPPITTRPCGQGGLERRG